MILIRLKVCSIFIYYYKYRIIFDYDATSSFLRVCDKELINFFLYKIGGHTKKKATDTDRIK